MALSIGSAPAATICGPLGWPLVEGYFGGALARDLEQGGEAAFASFAIDQLAALLGGDIRKRLHPVAASAWGRDPHARAAPTRTQDRVRRCQARCSPPRSTSACSLRARRVSGADFSTAHGAYRSGVAAAEQAIAALGA